MKKGKSETTKYIRNGKELISIRDRKRGITPYRRTARWVVYNVTEQRVLSEHLTRQAALSALAEI